jgi:RND superfamily putative drug exporter
MLWRLLGTAQVRLRVPLLLALLAGAGWVVASLPPIGGGSTIGEVVPKGAPAVTAERVSGERFGFPVITRTMVVVRRPSGLPPRRQASLAWLAVSLSQGRVPRFPGILGAVPLLNTAGLGSVTRERGTTAVIYLYFRPGTSPKAQTETARRLVREEIGHRPGEYEGVTGTAPGRYEQSALIEERLAWVELASLLLVVLAVGIHFRAVGAAGLTLLMVACSYALTDRLVNLFAREAGLELPAEIQPVLVVLVFGVATDYSIFYLSRSRTLLAQGVPRSRAIRTVVREVTPIIAAAGLTVAAGTAALSVAQLAALRAFGPGLAIAVVIAMATVMLLAPVVLAVAGERIFWPGGAARATSARAGAGARLGRRARSLLPARLAVRHPLPAALLALAAVLAGASGLRLLSVGNEVVGGLDGAAPVREAYEQASRGFTPGILAPSVVVVTGHGLGREHAALTRVEGRLRGQPGVAGVLGPGGPPGPGGATAAAVSQDGSAARYALLLERDPLGPRAIGDVRQIESRLPRILGATGLPAARGRIAGDTAISADVVHATLADLARVVPTMLAAIFIVIALFLRALVAPAYLVLTSVLAAASALGLGTYVMQQAVGYGGTAYYVIFTVTVLLVSLGSDYNVFMVGRIWEEGARGGRFPVAVERAAVRAARPIAVAGTLLALTFALLAIVPVRGFREIAFAMAVGLIVDAFIVRALLVPALVVLVGRRSGWPGHALEQPAPAPELPRRLGV